MEQAGAPIYRREFLGLTAAAAVAAIATPASAGVSLSGAFPFLDRFLALPGYVHSKFYLAYHAVRGQRPANDARASVIWPNGVKTQLPIGAGGQVTNLPTLAEIKAGATLEYESQPFTLSLELRAAIPPTQKVSVPELSASLAQVNGAVAKLAGPLAIVAPKVTAAYFPDSGGGRVILAGGRAEPLPMINVPYVGQVPYLEPATAAGAQTVELVRAPSRIVLAGRPKTS